MKEAATDKPADAWYVGHDMNDNDQYYASDYGKEVFVNFHGIESVCSNRHQSFPSRSLLYKHLKGACFLGNLRNPQAPNSSPTSLHVRISKATLDNIGSGLAFRGCSYKTASFTLLLHAMPLQSDLAASCCLDSGYGMTLVDGEWLFRHAPDEKILKRAVPLKVRNIRASKHESDEFVSMPICFLGVNKHKQPVYTRIDREIHLVDGLKANMLLGNDTIVLESIMINLANSTTFTTSCNVQIAIKARQRGQPLRKKLMADTTIFLLSNFESLVLVTHGTSLGNRDFFFQLV